MRNSVVNIQPFRLAAMLTLVSITSQRSTSHLSPFVCVGSCLSTTPQMRLCSATGFRLSLPGACTRTTSGRGRSPNSKCLWAHDARPCVEATTTPSCGMITGHRTKLSSTILAITKLFMTSLACTNSCLFLVYHPQPLIPRRLALEADVRALAGAKLLIVTGDRRERLAALFARDCVAVLLGSPKASKRTVRAVRCLCFVALKRFSAKRTHQDRLFVCSARLTVPATEPLLAVVRAESCAAVFALFVHGVIIPSAVASQRELFV